MATTLSTKAVRQRVAAALEALDGWRESPFVYERFAQHPDSFADQAFAVGVLQSRAEADEPQHSRRLARGALTRTQVAVAFTRRLRPKDGVESFDEALDAEDAARTAIMAVSRLDGLHLRWVGTDREMSANESWRLTTLTFEAQHRTSLE